MTVSVLEQTAVELQLTLWTRPKNDTLSKGKIAHSFLNIITRTDSSFTRKFTCIHIFFVIYLFTKQFKSYELINRMLLNRVDIMAPLLDLLKSQIKEKRRKLVFFH